MEKVNLQVGNTKEHQNQKSPGSRIKTCSIHGEYNPVVVKSFDGLRDIELSCQECVESKKVPDNKRQVLMSAGIPKRFLGSSFENFKVSTESDLNYRTTQKYKSTFAKIKKNGTSLIFCGLPGTGKTHLACALVMALIDAGYHAKYSTSYKLFAHIKSTYNKASLEHETQVIQKYIDCDLLILDEVGVQFGSEAERVLFYQVINGRYEDVLPTILISNEDKQGVQKFIGDRCFDRMCDGNGAVLSFDWKSHRK